LLVSQYAWLTIMSRQLVHQLDIKINGSRFKRDDKLG
jgi:hypothetical protein